MGVSRWRLGITLLFACTHLAIVTSGAAQARGGIVLAPTYQRWEFSDTVTQGSLRVGSVEQYAAPWAVILPFNQSGTWVADVSGAYAWSTMNRGAATDESRLDGPTDIRIRLVGPIVRDHLLLTLGYNAPNGVTKLKEQEVDQLGILASPSLAMAVPYFGVGRGGTAGLVLAQRVGRWALAFGGTYELRDRYTPEEIALASTKSKVQLDPADATHFTFGMDGLVGPHHVELMLTRDQFTENRLFFSEQGTDGASLSYKPGASVAFHGQFDFAAPRFRQLSVGIDRRQRSRFTDGEGREVAGSDGTFDRVYVSAILGSPRGFGVSARLAHRRDSGLSVDDSFITAATAINGFAAGVSIPAGNAFIDPFVQIDRGRFDLGAQSIRGKGLTYGIRVSPR